MSKDRTIYVVDRLASGHGLGSVFRIKPNTNTPEKIADQIRTGGQLVGIALTLDDSVLMVSSLDPKQGTAQVILINT